jgi:hypothetical protein
LFKATFVNPGFNGLSAADTLKHVARASRVALNIFIRVTMEQTRLQSQRAHHMRFFIRISDFIWPLAFSFLFARQRVREFVAIRVYSWLPGSNQKSFVTAHAACARQPTTPL